MLLFRAKSHRKCHVSSNISQRLEELILSPLPLNKDTSDIPVCGWNKQHIVTTQKMNSSCIVIGRRYLAIFMYCLCTV